jgi:uncharacterized DUF497 family protein
MVAHTERNENIRIISAREATKNEEKFVTAQPASGIG